MDDQLKRSPVDNETMALRRWIREVQFWGNVYETFREEPSRAYSLATNLSVTGVTSRDAIFLYLAISPGCFHLS